MTRAGHSGSVMIPRHHVVRGTLSCYVFPNEVDHEQGRGPRDPTIRGNRERSWKWLMQACSIEGRRAEPCPRLSFPCL